MPSGLVYSPKADISSHSGDDTIALYDWMDSLRAQAYAALASIRFEGMHFRRDIGAKGLRAPPSTP